MRIFIERFILAILAALVLFTTTTPMQISWWPTRIVSIIGIVIVAGIAAYFAGWNEWRWERIRAVWWLWSIFGISGGIALGLWLSPVVLGPPQQAENTELKTLAQSNAQDAAKWRFTYYLRYAPRSENNGLLTCKFMLVLSPGNAAWNLWVILQPMLELAHWESYPGPNLSRPETPFQGVTIISGENKDASACGAALGKSMGEAFPQIHVSFRSDQVSPALTACKNECVELDIGN
jgi:phosphate/sulfate permease